jgi:hypothetical protein
MRPSRPAEQHSTSSSDYLHRLVKSLKENKFTGEGNDVQELLNTCKEQFEAAVITVEPPDEFVKLITLDNLEDDEIDANAYYNQKLWALLFQTTSKSANRTVRQFAASKNGHLAWKALHHEFLPQADALSRTVLLQSGSRKCVLGQEFMMKGLPREIAVLARRELPSCAIC